MRVQVLDLPHFVDQAASLAKPSQPACKRTQLATTQNVQQRAPIAARISPHHAQVRLQNAQRLTMNALGKVSDWGLYGRPSQSGFGICRALERKDAQGKPLPLQLQNLVANESFRETWKHLYHITYFLRREDSHPEEVALWIGEWKPSTVRSAARTRCNAA